jgi:uncharacterized protein YdeI (YjbR/CyaY-like superfamily)
MILSKSVAYPPGTPAPCQKIKINKWKPSCNQQKEQTSVFLSFSFRRRFLSSFHNRALGEAILEIPISSANNQKKQNKTEKDSEKEHAIVFFWFSLRL